MWTLAIIFGLLHTSVLSQWQCATDQDCADVSESVCASGACVCDAGSQLVLGGRSCVALSPYHTSTCVEDHQCSRLFTAFECRRENQVDEEGSCLCQAGYHYFYGRCWLTTPYGAACTHSEQCLDIPRDPFSLSCNGVCGCAPGYYERQRGECRKIGYVVGDGCVLTEDCQFANGVCDINTLRCVDSTANEASRVNANVTSASVRAVNVTSASMTAVNLTSVSVTAVRSHGTACSVLAPCPSGFECSMYGSCICPVGYYSSNDGSSCFAELGSPSTAAQCIGLLAEVRDGVCTCPANFYFEDNMRDCVKVTRIITDSCVTDENCHTFGATSYCGEEQEPWFLRTCACDAERSVWDGNRQMCRLFAGIGEECEVDSDCLAGELEIQCVSNVCTCPAGLTPSDGLCLTTGLTIGESCQVSAECTGTANTACAGGVCACDEGYRDIDGFCAPIIGGSCQLDSDCVIPDTVCTNDTRTCQCGDGLVAYDDICWPAATNYQAPCNVSVQCAHTLGENSACEEERCICEAGYHYRDGRCWPVTGLFEACDRTSVCFLASSSDRVVCRNSLCQCDFDYPYSEQLHTCLYVSSASNIAGSASVLALAVSYLLLS